MAPVETTMTSGAEDNTPKTTGNSLKDIVGWLATGDMVILHTGTGEKKIYHNNDLPYNRKIYVDVSSMPDLMDEGEWPFYIKQSNVTELSDDIKACPNGNFSFVLPSLGGFYIKL